MDLATRLKSFLTPDQIEKLSVALENIEMREWTKNNPPAPSPAPDKILDWESGDWWSDLAGGCWQHRGNKCRMLEVDGTLSDWRVTARPIAHGEFRLDDADGDKRAASKGYTVCRTAKVEPTRAVEAKGEVEKDIHGRTIIARNDYAMVVECGSNKDDDGRFQISSACGTFWYVGQEGYWLRNHHPNTGVHTVEWCMKNLPQAANVPLPTANPAASAKGDDGDIDAMRIAWNGVNTTTSYREDFLFGELLKLKREVAALKAVK